MSTNNMLKPIKMFEYAHWPKMSKYPVFWSNQTHKITPVAHYGLIWTSNSVQKHPCETHLKCLMSTNSVLTLIKTPLNMLTGQK